jgi:sugar (pentulose or hexulose) kinase
MMSREALIGIDIGTTNLKILAAAPSGRTLALASRTMGILRPAPGAAEFDTGKLRRDLASGLAEIRERLPDHRVLSVAFCSVGESMVGLDGAGERVTPLPVWYDRRTANGRAEMGIALEPWLDATGMVDDDFYTVHRIRWLRARHPGMVARVRHWLMAADYGVWLLTGARVTAPCLAGRSGLFDRRSGDWWEEILAAAGIARDSLPAPRPAATVAGQVSAGAAAWSGLAEGTPVVNAGHDHPCAGVGCGLVEPGPVMDSTGTAEAIMTVTLGPLGHAETGGAYDCFAHAVPGRCVVSGHLPAAGGSFDWMLRLAGGDAPDIARLIDEAAASPPGAHGVRFLPFLEGTGAPFNRRGLSGSLAGLRSHHVRGDVLRAVLEGLGRWLALNLDRLDAMSGARREPLIAVGGGVRVAPWLAMKAAMTGRAIRLPRIEEAAALGAALVGGLAVGRFGSVAEASPPADLAFDDHHPDPELAEAYAGLADDLAAPWRAAGLA